MRKIILLGAAPFGDTMRYPSEGPIEVEPAEAKRLIEAGLAKSDDLEAETVATLTEIAAEEGAFVPDRAKKAELVEAIRDTRAQ